MSKGIPTTGFRLTSNRLNHGILSPYHLRLAQELEKAKDLVEQYRRLHGNGPEADRIIARELRNRRSSAA